MRVSDRSRRVVGLRVVGLTGGIASGKTTVADEFGRLGVPIVDADVCARTVVAPGSEGLAAIAAHHTGLDLQNHVRQAVATLLQDRGELDRAELRRRVFADSGLKTWLEGLLHPLIRDCMDRELDRIAADGPASGYAIAVIPLLVETGQSDRFDRVLVVDVTEDAQVRRLLQRDGGDPEQAGAILAAQAGRQQRLAVADDVIANDADLQTLRERVREQHLAYLALFSKPADAAVDDTAAGTE